MTPQILVEALSGVELDKLNCWSQCLLSCCAGSLIAVFVYLLHVYRRRMKGEEAAGESKVKMNCWFCNEDVHLQFGEKESWKCPHCEQYNGFTENGDYSQLVSDQFDVKDFKTPTVCSPSEFTIAKSVLCETCNQNQMLKVRQLAAFIPFSEASYNDEVDVYSAYLENRYSLCDTCKSQVSQYLTAQDKKLAITMADEHKCLLDQLSTRRQNGYNDNQVEAATSKQTFLPCLMFSLCVCAGITHIIFSLTIYTASSSPQNMTRISHLINTSLPALPGCLTVWAEQASVYFGAIFCSVGLLAVGKYSLYPEDVVHLLLWLLLVLLNSDILAVPLFWLSLARERILFFTAATVLLSSMCCLRHRLPRHFTAVTIQKKQIYRPDLTVKATAQNKKSSSDDVKKVDKRYDAARKVGTSDTSLSCLPSCAPCDAQLESVHQDLESLSLGLRQKSGSTSSIWSLPAIVSASCSSMTPDSTTEQSAESAQKSRRVLYPSRLGFLSLDSVLRDGRCSPLWSQISGNLYSPAHNSSQDVAQTQQPGLSYGCHNVLQPGLSYGCHSVFQPGLKRFISDTPVKSPFCGNVCKSPSCDIVYKSAFRSPACVMQLSTLQPEMGPCDSQTPDTAHLQPHTFTSEVNRHHNVKKSEKERISGLPQQDRSWVSWQHARNIPAQTVGYRTDSIGLRRSQRLAMTGRLPKPWPLKKSLSCTNINNREYKERSWSRRDRWGENATCDISCVQNSHLSPVEEVLGDSRVCQTAVRSVQNDRTAQTDILPDDQVCSKDLTPDHAVSEFSDDECDDSDSMVQTDNSKGRTRNDCPWTWMLVGAVMGASLTTNIFLICWGRWVPVGPL